MNSTFGMVWVGGILGKGLRLIDDNGLVTDFLSSTGIAQPPTMPSTLTGTIPGAAPLPGSTAAASTIFGAKKSRSDQVKELKRLLAKEPPAVVGKNKELPLAVVGLDNDGITVAATIGASSIYSGLVTNLDEDDAYDGTGRADVRSELVTAMNAGPEVAKAFLKNTVDIVRRNPGKTPLGPGTLIKNVVPLEDNYEGPEPDYSALEDEFLLLTARHCLLTSPWLWEDNGAPHFIEQPGKVFRMHRGDPISKDMSRLTMMLQVVPLTDSEFVYAQAYGVDALQKEMIEGKVNLLDVFRS